jgi:hypothetical protein
MRPHHSSSPGVLGSLMPSPRSASASPSSRRSWALLALLAVVSLALLSSGWMLLHTQPSSGGAASKTLHVSGHPCCLVHAGACCGYMSCGTLSAVDACCARCNTVHAADARSAKSCLGLPLACACLVKRAAQRMYCRE